MAEKVYAVPTEGNGKARSRFQTEAGREAHRVAIRRRDAMRSAAKKAAKSRKKLFKIGSGFHQL